MAQCSGHVHCGFSVSQMRAAKSASDLIPRVIRNPANADRCRPDLDDDHCDLTNVSAGAVPFWWSGYAAGEVRPGEDGHGRRPGDDRNST